MKSKSLKKERRSEVGPRPYLPGCIILKLERYGEQFYLAGMQQEKLPRLSWT